MVDNRISLRLDDNEIRAIEEFMAAHREFASRSHLAREAIRSFIEEGKGWTEQSGTENASPRARTFKVTLAPIEASLLEQLVAAGYYLDISDGIRRIVGKSVMENHMEKTIGDIHDARRKLVQMDQD